MSASADAVLMKPGRAASRRGGRMRGGAAARGRCPATMGGNLSPRAALGPSIVLPGPGGSRSSHQGSTLQALRGLGLAMRGAGTGTGRYAPMQGVGRGSGRNAPMRRLCAQMAEEVDVDVDEDGAGRDSTGIDKLRKALRSGSDGNERQVRAHMKTVEIINALEASMMALSDEDLGAKTDEFRARLSAGETTEDIMPEAFAVVREASRRVLGMRHFDVQLVGGMVLHNGQVAEMRTGEGKTLVATLPSYLNALTGRGVHVVTVNDYLARRDSEFAGRVHRFLGLTVGCIQSAIKGPQRAAEYGADITYATNQELGFDYLRDNMATEADDLVIRRPFHYAVVDEVDSVLIDEGRNPLLISRATNVNAEMYPRATEVAEALRYGLDYTVEVKVKSAELTERGVALAEQILGVADLWSEEEGEEPWGKYVLNAIKAKDLYLEDVHYIVRDGEVQIVDEFTGRAMPSRRWTDNIHQSVESKERVEIQSEQETAASITYQCFFKLYPKLSGMTGTAATEAEELWQNYRLTVLTVPTNRPGIRLDEPSPVYKTQAAKWKAVALMVYECYGGGRPVLVGTTSVEHSEIISSYLERLDIPHNLLNARPQYAAVEAQIIAQAGRLGAVTIATNMAGRGTDIILGGAAEGLVLDRLRKELLPLLVAGGAGALEEAQFMPDRGLVELELSPLALGKLARARAAASVAGRGAGGAGGPSMELEDAEAFLKGLVTRADKESAAAGPGGGAGAGEAAAGSGDLQEAILGAARAVLGEFKAHCAREGDEVRRIGGLRVVGTQLHDSRRVDNQLRGRAGRQGDPGSAVFVLSLEDELIQIHGGAMVANVLDSVGLDIDDAPITGKMIDRELINLQKTVEQWYAGHRKQIVKYDLFMEVQRNYVYGLRRRLLTGDSRSTREVLHRYMQASVDAITAYYVDPNRHPKHWDLGGLVETVRDVAPPDAVPPGMDPALAVPLPSLDVEVLRSFLAARKPLEQLRRPPAGLRASVQARRLREERLSGGHQMAGDEDRLAPHWAEAEALRVFLGEGLAAAYELRAAKMMQLGHMDPQAVASMEKYLALNSIDQGWANHLKVMSLLRNTVSLRSFGQLDPLDEYKIDSSKAFLEMLDRASLQAVRWLFQYTPSD